MTDKKLPAPSDSEDKKIANLNRLFNIAEERMGGMREFPKNNPHRYRAMHLLRARHDQSCLVVGSFFVRAGVYGPVE